MRNSLLFSFVIFLFAFTSPKPSFAQGTPLCISINNYGGDPTGTTPSDGAWLNALAAVSSSTTKCIEFGAGTYKFNATIKYTQGISENTTVKGQGRANTILNWPSGGGITITESSATGGNRDSVNISGFRCITGVAGGSSCIELDAPGGITNSPSKISDIEGYGNSGSAYWDNVIFSNGGSFLDITNVFAYGRVVGTPAGNGVTLNPYGGGTSSSIVFNITNLSSIATNYGVFTSGDTEGVNIQNSNFTGGNYGISATGPANLQLEISNSQFNVFNDALYLPNGGQGIGFIDNLILCGFNSSATGFGVVASGAGGMTIIGNQFYSNASTTTAVSITGTSVQGFVTISGNTFTTLTNAINLGAGTTNDVVMGNAYFNVTNRLTNSGSNNIILDTLSPGTLNAKMQIVVNQPANNSDDIVVERFTDTAPTGPAFRVVNAANTASLYELDVNGNETSPSGASIFGAGYTAITNGFFANNGGIFNASTGTFIANSPASAAGAFDFAGRQHTNSGDIFLGQRFTDSAPSGSFIRLENAANNASVFLVDVDGNATSFGLANFGSYYAAGTAGVTCSGTPSASYAVKNGIVTHC